MDLKALWDSSNLYGDDRWIWMSKHVQRLILEARIEELNTMSTDYLLARSSRIAELQKELEGLK